MAKKNQNLDNFFREKLSGYEMPERKGNWHLLNHLLDARDRRRRMVRRILFLSSFVMVAIVSVLIFIPGHKKSENASAGKAASKELNRSVAPAPVMDMPAKENKVAGPGANTLPDRNNDRKNMKGKMKEVRKNSARKIRNENFLNARAGISDNTTEAPKEKAEELGLKDKVQETQPSLTNADADVLGNRQGDAPLKDISQKSLQTEQTKTSEAAVEVTGETENKNSANTAPPPADAVVKDSSANDSLTSQAPPKDSAYTISAKDTSKFRQGLGFTLFAGLNLYRTQNLSLNDERNISPMLGMELMYPFSRHFIVGLGTAYSLQGGYHLSDTATQVFYFLEKNVSQQIILIRKQHMLYVPLTVYYVISDKHAVSGGIHWSYLINTVGDYTQINKVSGTTTQSQKKDVKGYMDGIKSSAFSFAAGYRFSISKKFDVSARIMQNLTDPYVPEYFYGVNAAPSWSLQTFISIKF